MNTRRTLLFAALPAALSIAACGGDDGPAAPTDTALDAFTGTWTASAWVYSPLGGGAEVSQMPISFVMTVSEGGACVIDQHFQQDPGPRHLTGSVSVPSPGNVWIIAIEAGGDDENFAGTYVFSNGGNTLTMVSVDDWWFDFDFDGVQDPAQLRIVLTKM
ncbi:MAG: hypothetical protein RLN75_01230 [Longimicrobiales bacterium]